MKLDSKNILNIDKWLDKKLTNVYGWLNMGIEIYIQLLQIALIKWKKSMSTCKYFFDNWFLEISFLWRQTNNGLKKIVNILLMMKTI